MASGGIPHDAVAFYAEPTIGLGHVAAMSAGLVQPLVDGGAGMPGGAAWMLGRRRLATRPRGVSADHPRL
ncbi:MAG: hypothetical protein ACRCSN_00760 [Dermatophilaceae bacterium]